MATVKDVAREAGVSLGTVSNVLNGKGSVKSQNREKVYEAMKKLGFHYNMTASALRTKTTKNIGLIIPSIANPFYPELARGVEDEARKEGFTVFLCNSDREEEKERKYIDALLSKGVDGLILLKPKSSHEELRKLNESRPLVVEDWDYREDQELLTVSTDGYMAVIQGMNLLAGYGHRRIAFISGLMESPSGHGKMKAYMNSLEARNIRFRPEYLVYGDYTWNSGYSVTKELLRLETLPTAILAANDMMAMGAMKAIQAKGYRIPEEISVMGIDDIEMGKLCTPALTTILQPKYEVGVSAFCLLKQALDGENIPADKRHITLNTRTVERESVTYAQV
ncbi:MAG: LacI family transcriptional regulator [Clostridium sp.]|nr:LacI family transcriptional regulator [Clostridium sp.]